MRSIGKRRATELLFIVVHNGAVSFLAALAWAVGSPSLALYAFSLEVGYEVFDTYSLRLRRLEPETLIHHVVSPICILCSTQTQVDYRVLCHLCICIDVSGAVLGYSKFLLHYAHVSASRVYRRLMWIYGLLRVVLTLIDTTIIIREEIIARGGLFVVSSIIDEEGKYMALAKTDWTQLYFWAIAVLNAFNVYFFCVIRARAQLPPHIVANYEARMAGCH
uniref:TLC domain-containing protein n=1 Tax=Alexandrium catenella TaxID=2925 RepID=A0A7S1RDS0_ALECA